jgi:uroporphyrinogen-III synthase
VSHLSSGPAIVCLGATTAEAARAAGLHVDRVAERTDLPILVEAVATVLGVPA